MPAARGDWSTIRSPLPYLWDFRGRVALALGCLFIAKLANVGVPLVLKEIVDSLDQTKAPLTLPIILLIGYGPSPAPCSPSCATSSSPRWRSGRSAMSPSRPSATCTP
ncbi:MAG: hypothetical protein ACREXK_13960 [Gammaproteobacteria bacterium]